MKKLILSLGFFLPILLFAAAVIGYEDWQLRGSAPGNPASGFFRIWADNAGQYFKCLTSSGAACYFDPKATSSTPGIVQTDGSTITNASGTISCTTATTSQLGCVKPDGSTVTISGGVISATGGGGGGGSAVAPTSGLAASAPPTVGSLTWINQGSATASNPNGNLLLTAPANATDSIRMLVKSLPATPYTFTIGYVIDSWTLPATLNTGICIRDSSSGRLIQWGTVATSGVAYGIYVQYWNSATSWSSAPKSSSMNGTLGLSSVFFYRITDDGTNLTFSFSISGQTFTTFYGPVSRTAWLSSPNQIGIMADSANNQAVPMFVYYWNGI